ncbi:MAG: hypothetical protein RLZ98_3617 [Pseudomonadota bacterium]|jgi:DNA-binding MarR family transcriptional regulator
MPSKVVDMARKTGASVVECTEQEAAGRLSRIHMRPGHLIRRAQQIAVAIFLDECANSDLTPVQYAALVAIEANPDIDATRLSAIIAFDRSTLGDVLERLETKGLVTRRASPDDKRIKLVRIAPKGRRLVAEVEDYVERAQARILEPLSTREQEQLVALLAKLADAHNETSRVPLRAPKRVRS